MMAERATCDNEGPQCMAPNRAQVYTPESNQQELQFRRDMNKLQPNSFRGDGLKYERNTTSQLFQIQDELEYLREREQEEKQQKRIKEASSMNYLSQELLLKIVRGVLRESKKKKNGIEKALTVIMRVLIQKEQKQFQRECPQSLRTIDEIEGAIKQILKFKFQFTTLNAQIVFEYFHIVSSLKIQDKFQSVRKYKAKCWVPVFEGSIQNDIKELLQRPVGIHVFCRPLFTIAICLSKVCPELGLDKWIQDIRQETQDLNTYFSGQELEIIQFVISENGQK